MIRSNAFVAKTWWRASAEAHATGLASMTPELQDPSPHRLRSVAADARIWLLVAAAIKILLVAGRWRWAAADARHDDQLFMRQARSLVAGEWLGPYDVTTLIKGPGYALWVYANSLQPLPLWIADQLLYVVACALFVAALAPVMRSGGQRVALFAVLVFNPMSYTQAALRLARDSIYPSQTLLVLACLFGMWTSVGRSSKAFLAWAAGLGLCAGFFWISREEALWILPAAGLVYAQIGYRLWRERPPHGARFAVGLALAPLLTAAPVWLVSSANERHYGVFAVSELKRPEFVAAIGALSRVAYQSELEYVTLPRETWRRIYVVSPAFRELRPVLEGSVGAAWSALSAQHLGPDVVERGEIAGGWFLWALRDAAMIRRHHQSGAAAMRYYARLADEVNAACDDGRLDAGPPRATLAPPWQASYLRPALRSLGRGALALVTFESFRTGPLSSSGPQEYLSAFRAITGDRITAAGPGVLPGIPIDGARGWRLRVSAWIGTAYRWLMPASTLALGLGVIVGSSIALARRRALDRQGWLAVAGSAHLLAPALVVAVAILTRLVLLAYLDVTSFRALYGQYLAPLYPLVLALACFVAIDGVSVYRSWRSRLGLSGLRAGARDSAIGSIGRAHGTVVHGRRVRVLAGWIAELIPHGSRVLDVGSGDGRLAAHLLERRSDLSIEGLDVLVRPGVAVPTREFDGREIPHPAGAFDVVVLVDVLHHAADAEALLGEAARVARCCVVIKDHDRAGFGAGATLAAMDWVGNRAHGIGRSCRYLAPAEWLELFRRVGLEPRVRHTRLGLYVPPLAWFFERSLHFITRLEPLEPPEPLDPPDTGPGEPLER